MPSGGTMTYFNTSYPSSSIYLSSGGDINFHSNASGTPSVRMVIKPDGNVGIGHTAPIHKLYVSGDIGQSDGSRIWFRGSSSSSATGAQSYIYSNSLNLQIKGDDNVQLLGDSGSVILHADYSGRVGIATGSTQPTYKLDVGGDIGTDRYIRHNGDTNTYFGFSGDDTIQFNTNSNERMRITSSGDVGIGTTSPTHNLHVNGTVKVTGTQTFDVASGGGSYISINHTGNESWTWGAQSGSGSDDYLDVGISGGTRAMSWHEDGSVGIGTTTPNADVNIIGKMGSVTSDWKTALNIGTTEEPTYSVASISVKNEGKEMMLGSNLHFDGESSLNTKPDASKGSSAIVMSTNNSTSTTTGTTIIGGHYAITDGASSSLVSHVTVNGDGNTTFGGQVYLDSVGATLTIGETSETHSTVLWTNNSDTFYVQQDVDGAKMQFETDKFTIKNVGAAETMFVATENGSVDLYYDNSKKAWTTSSGFAVGGIITANDGSAAAPTHTFGDTDTGMYRVTTNSLGFTTGGTNALTLDASQNATFTGNISNTSGQIIPNELSMGDNKKILLGNGDDLEIYHDGSNSYIAESGTGNLYIRASERIRLQGVNGEALLYLNENSNVELYYDNSLKLNTTSGGVDCSGYYGFTSTGNDYGFYYGVEPGSTQGIAIKSSDTGGAYFDGLGYFWNSNTGDGANMFQMQNDGDTYCRYINFFRGSNSNIIGWIGYNATNTATTFSTSSSDERLKKNIVDWNESVLPKFLSLEPKQFHFNSQDDSEGKNKGYIAQNEVDNFPEVYQLNGKDDDARYGFHPMEMTPYLMKAIKELVEKNKELENRLEALEN